MDYKIDLSSLPRIQKGDVWDFVDWGEVFSTAFKSVIGVPIAFAVLGIFSGEWHLSVSGWLFLILVITGIVNSVKATERRDKAYSQAKEHQDNWPIEKTRKLNSIISQNQRYCQECGTIRNQIVSKMNSAQDKYNRNLFGQYWDMIESITKSFDEYKTQVSMLKHVQKDYYREVRQIDAEHNFPSTILNMSMVPLVDKELREFKDLRELGESHRDFANIWEQRRTREAIITGFKDLQASVEGIGGAITQELKNLRISLNK
ncbi:MAG: hypothetical protein P8144_14755 [Gammaproteobacteria bacterium]